jgi:hypothetical protein
MDGKTIVVSGEVMRAAIMAYISVAAGVNTRGLEKAMQAALPLLLGEPVGTVCLNTGKYAHNHFASIEIQLPSDTSPLPNIGAVLYTVSTEPSNER